MKTLIVAISVACMAVSSGALAQQASVQLIVKNEAGVITSDITVRTTDEALAAINEHRRSFIETPAVAEVRAAPQMLTPAVLDVDGKVVTPAVYETEGQIITPARPAVLRYPTRGSWWRMVILGNIKSIAGDQTKAVLAKKKLAEAAQAAVEVEKEKVAQ